METFSDIQGKFIDNTVDLEIDPLQFHALIHRIHEQFHDSEVSISKRYLQIKGVKRKCMKKKAYQSLA